METVQIFKTRHRPNPTQPIQQDDDTILRTRQSNRECGATIVERHNNRMERARETALRTAFIYLPQCTMVRIYNLAGKKFFSLLFLILDV